MGDEAVRYGDINNPTDFGCTSNDVRVAETEVLDALNANGNPLPTAGTALPDTNPPVFPFVCSAGEVIQVRKSKHSWRIAQPS